MLKAIIKLRIEAESATAGPPLGPILGQYGIPINDFCKRYNELTKGYNKGLLLSSIVMIYINKEYTIQITDISNTEILKKIINTDVLSGDVNSTPSTLLVITRGMLLESFKYKYMVNNSIKSLKGYIKSTGVLLLKQ